ncbi:MAG: MarC family protein [Hyphomicrobiales bacterium]
MVTVTTLAAADPSLKNDLIIAACLAAILALNLVCFYSAGKIVEKIGPALPIIGKIMGLLLTALAVQLMIGGFQELGVIPL